MTSTPEGSKSVTGRGVTRHVLGAFDNVARNANPNTHTASSQCGQILAHLQKGHRLTAVGALSMFGCARLAARIENLRGEGWPIISEAIKVVNRDGKSVRVAQYYLDQGAV